MKTFDRRGWKFLKSTITRNDIYIKDGVGMLVRFDAENPEEPTDVLYCIKGAKAPEWYKTEEEAQAAIARRNDERVH